MPNRTRIVEFAKSHQIRVLIALTVAAFVVGGVWAYPYWRTVIWDAGTTTVTELGGVALALSLLLTGIGLAIHFYETRHNPKGLGSFWDEAKIIMTYTAKPLVVVGFALFAFNLAVVPFRMDSTKQRSIKQLQPANALDLYFRSQVFSSGQDVLQFNDTTLTNRSGKTMNLVFAAHLYFVDRNKATRRLSIMGEMNPLDLVPFSGVGSVEIPPGKSKKVSLVYFLPKPSEYDADKWPDDMMDTTIVQAFDSVTGIKDCFYGSQGCPEGRVQQPIPSASLTQAEMTMQLKVLPH